MSVECSMLAIGAERYEALRRGGVAQRNAHLDELEC